MEQIANVAGNPSVSRSAGPIKRTDANQRISREKPGKNLARIYVRHSVDGPAAVNP